MFCSSCHCTRRQFAGKRFSDYIPYSLQEYFSSVVRFYLFLLCSAKRRTNERTKEGTNTAAGFQHELTSVKSAARLAPFSTRVHSSAAAARLSKRGIVHGHRNHCWIRFKTDDEWKPEDTGVVVEVVVFLAFAEYSRRSFPD